MIQEEQHGEIALLRMSRGKGNALSTEFLEALIDMVDRLEKGPARAAVLTGERTVFSAGVDLPALLAGSVDDTRRFLEILVRFFHRLAVCEKPIVAAVNGHAIAGGCIIMLACDYRVAARLSKAKIGVTELLVGVPFPAWPLEIVRFAVPPQHFQALVYTGMTVNPDEALARGMVDEVVEADALLERALEMARLLAAVPAATFKLSKGAMRQPLCEAVARTSRLYDADAMRAWQQPETLAHIRQFVERTIGRKD